ncbi:hypothetical protein D3C85_997660 [compost metagenome]
MHADLSFLRQEGFGDRAVQLWRKHYRQRLATVVGLRGVDRQGFPLPLHRIDAVNGHPERHLIDALYQAIAWDLEGLREHDKVGGRIPAFIDSVKLSPWLHEPQLDQIFLARGGSPTKLHEGRDQIVTQCRQRQQPT